ncbi:MAG: hypothetical protein CL609_07545 [Anaerolineaceae bacterium]|nr:hypothetical protein [Anaerolineaceae bacterium]
MLCFDLQINYEHLDGKNKLNKIASLIEYAEKQGLYSHLLHQLQTERPHVSWQPKIPTDIPQPYRGLSPFREEDASFFYGRTAYTVKLLAAIEEQVFTVLVSSSGGGKSSIVCAGLVPELRKQAKWYVVSFRPGKYPFRALAASLILHLETDLSETARLIEIERLTQALKEGTVSLRNVLSRIQEKHDALPLLFIDQFEEIFTLSSSGNTQQLFLDLLLTTIITEESLPYSPPWRVLLALRADFLGQALAYRPFADTLQGSLIILGPMDRNELYQAITQPAAQVGIYFETGLVDRILDDVGHEPGNLPLIQFALTQLWQRQEVAQLTHEAYEIIGKADGALAQYADEIYQKLNDVQKKQARYIFTQLVQPGIGTEDTRRIANRDDLQKNVWETILILADKRLVVTGRDEAGRETVELAHEALTRRWEQLQTWMQADRAFRLWQERLRVYRTQWEKTDQDPNALLRGAALAESEQWLTDSAYDLSQPEKAYIQTSLEQQRVEQEKADARLKQELAVAQKLTEEAEARQAIEAQRAMENQRAAKRLMAGVIILGLLAIGLGVAVYILDNTNQRLARETQESLSLSLAAFSDAILHEDTMLAHLLSIEADRRSVSPQAFQAIYDSSRLVNRPHLALRVEGFINVAKWNQEETLILSAGLDGTARIWDSQTGNLVLELPHEAQVYDAKWNEDQSRILTNSVDGTAKVWNAHTGELFLTLSHMSTVTNAMWNENESRILTNSVDGTAKVWDAESGELILILSHDNSVQNATWNGDESQILTNSVDSTAKVWDAESGELILILSHDESVTSAIWNEDESRILTISVDGAAKVWDAQTGELLFTLSHDDAVTNAIWNKDESRILTSSRDQIVKVWNAQTGDVLQSFTHSGSVTSAEWNKDESRILTNSDAIRIWDAETGELLLTLDYRVWGVQWNEDETSILGYGSDGNARVWDAQSGTLILALSDEDENQGPSAIKGATWNKDETSILTYHHNGKIQIWNALPHDLIPTLTHEDWVGDANWNRNESQILSYSDDGTARIWDSRTGEQLFMLAHNDVVWSAKWNRDESQIMTMSKDGTVKVWSAQTGEMIFQLTHDNWAWIAKWNNDESHIMTASRDGTTKVWDAKTGVLLFTVAHESEVWDAQWNQDESLVVTYDTRGPARVWDARTGEFLHTLNYEDWAEYVQWGLGPDEPFPLVISGEGAVTVRASEYNLGISYPWQHSGQSNQWSQYESRAVVIELDGGVRIWDSDPSIMLAEPEGDGTRVVTAKWNLDGSQIMVTTAGGSIIRYFIDQEDRLIEACKRATRNLSWDEWQFYLPSEPYRQTCNYLPVHPSIPEDQQP